MTLSFAQKAGVATAAVVALGAASLGALAVTADAQPVSHRAGTPAATEPVSSASRTAAPRVVTQVIAAGVVDGLKWSVVLEFHPTLPKGYEVPEFEGRGVPSGARKAMAAKSSLLCQRMVIGGVRIDHQGGPWADCQAVEGAHDLGAAGGAGLWGLQDKGTSGSRLFVSSPEADVAYGVVVLADGTRLKAGTVVVPGTSYRAWAVAIPDGKTIAAVDAYDAHDRRLSHDTDWR